MTREEAKAIIRKEYLCVDRDCDIEKNCGKCDLMMPSKEPILEAYKVAIKALEQEPCEDAISRQAVLDAFADYVGSGMSMNDFDALWDIVAKMPAVKQEPKFLAKSDGTIEQIKNCNDCLFKKEWEKIGELLSNILEKHTEQEPCEDAISRQAVINLIRGCNNALEEPRIFDCHNAGVKFEQYITELPSVNPTKTGHCKVCKYFEYDSVAKVDGIPLIVAHEICKRWGDGCKTKEDGYCFMFEPQESEDKGE